MLPFTTKGLVLDAGCGEHVWRAPGWKVFRCDNGETYLGEKRKLPTGILHADLNNRWPYRTNAFHGVISTDVIEHVENLWHFFREATRISRWFVIVATPNTTSKVSKALFAHYGRFWSFTENSVKTSHHITPVFLWQIKLAAKKCGWKVDRVRYANTKYYELDDHPKVSGIIRKQPGKRNIVVRMVSPKFSRAIRRWGGP
jgi:hypothetical protein